MTIISAPPPTGQERPLRGRRTVAIAAASVPVLVLGQFALLAIIPVAITLISTWRRRPLRRLRAWATGLGVVYAIPLALWAIGPDRAPSLSKDMNPILGALIAAAGVALLVRTLLLRKASRRD